MSLKDKPLFESVFNMNLAVIVSAILVVGMAFIFFVFAKGNFMKQAEEHAKKLTDKAKYDIAQVKDNTDNNKLLWSLVDSTWRSPDKSRAFVKKLADSSKRPRCNGKECVGDDARLKTSIVNSDKERSISVQCAKYYFKVLYDNKDKFLTVDVSDLLDKTSGASMEESAEEGGEE
jgi:hypothetical protein